MCMPSHSIRHGPDYAHVKEVEDNPEPRPPSFTLDFPLRPRLHASPDFH